MDIVSRASALGSFLWMATHSSCDPSFGLSKKLETFPFGRLGINTLDLPHGKSVCIDVGDWSRPGPTAWMEHVTRYFRPLEWEFHIGHLGASQLYGLAFSEPQKRPGK